MVSHLLPVTDPEAEVVRPLDTDPEAEVVRPLGTAQGVQHHLGVQTHSGVRPLVTDPEAEVVRPLATAPGVQPHSVEVLLLVIAPEPEMFITHQEIPEITDLLNPHWEIS